MQYPIIATLTTDVVYYDLDDQQHVCKAQTRVTIARLDSAESIDAAGRSHAEEQGALVANHDGVWFDIKHTQFKADS